MSTASVLASAVRRSDMRVTSSAAADTFETLIGNDWFGVEDFLRVQQLC
jgi:hypothetical protein